MFLDKTFSRHKILLGPKVFRPEILLDPKKILNSNFFCTQNWMKNFLVPQFFSKKFSRPKIYFGLKFLYFKFFSRSEIFLVPKFLDQKFNGSKKIFEPKFFRTKIFSDKTFFQTTIFRNQNF